MAEVLIIFKVLPADAGLDPEELIDRIRGLKVASLHGVLRRNQLHSG